MLVWMMKPIIINTLYYLNGMMTDKGKKITKPHVKHFYDVACKVAEEHYEKERTEQIKMALNIAFVVLNNDAFYEGMWYRMMEEWKKLDIDKVSYDYFINENKRVREVRNIHEK